MNFTDNCTIRGLELKLTIRPKSAKVFRTSDHRTLSIPHYAGNSAGGLSLP